jgi:hypothetical protein
MSLILFISFANELAKTPAIFSVALINAGVWFLSIPTAACEGINAVEKSIIKQRNREIPFLNFRISAPCVLLILL